MPGPRVKDWMTRHPVTIHRGSSILETRELMDEEQVRRLLVLDDDGTLIGVVTAGDVREAWPSPVSSLEPFERKAALAEIPIEEVIEHDPISVHPDATIQEAADMMFENKIGGLPVVADGKLLGLITQSDLIRGLVRMLDETERAERQAVPKQ
ncbi:MAG: CBS domain-containing protein [Anaerolineae bacterium]|nr:CBS domain-containing protein [Anaerolineae bacterium]